MQILRFMLLALGMIGILISLPLLGFAALGFLGILADVGPDENRAIGMQAMALSLPPLICGVLLCALGFLTLARNRRRQDTAADGGGRSSF